MVYDYHRNRRRYFEHQKRVTAGHVIPFVERSAPLGQAARVLEIGCAEAGVLSAFLERGARCVGVDMNSRRLDVGRQLLSREVEAGRLELLCRDARELGEDDAYRGSFDLIVLKDVVEHVHDRPRLLAGMRRLLSPTGRAFLSFPPWRMPFGGHQQVCKSRLLSRWPYLHLLPPTLYRGLLERLGETPRRVQGLLETRETRLSIAGFERLCASSGFAVLERRHYLVNPMYAYRFGIRPREQHQAVSALGGLADFVTTCAYYLVAPGEGQ